MAPVVLDFNIYIVVAKELQIVFWHDVHEFHAKRS
jgi:hypothetical protein